MLTQPDAAVKSCKANVLRQIVHYLAKSAILNIPLAPAWFLTKVRAQPTISMEEISNGY